MALGYKPSIQVCVSLGTDGHNAPVSIGVSRRAGDWTGTNLVGQGKRRPLPAPVFDAAAVRAGLRALWGVHAVKPYALAGNLKGIAINHGRASGNCFGMRLGEQEQAKAEGEQKEEEGTWVHEHHLGRLSPVSVSSAIQPDGPSSCTLFLFRREG
jgi:hypothetical protein